jgi:hypothetical protein
MTAATGEAAARFRGSGLAQAQIVRPRLSSPVFAFATMPWKYPPGVERKRSAGLARDNRDRNRRLLAAHGLARVAPEGFRDTELTP